MISHVKSYALKYMISWNFFSQANLQVKTRQRHFVVLFFRRLWLFSAAWAQFKPTVAASARQGTGYQSTTLNLVVIRAFQNQWGRLDQASAVWAQCKSLSHCCHWQYSELSCSQVRPWLRISSELRGEVVVRRLSDSDQLPTWSHSWWLKRILSWNSLFL